MAFLDVMTLAIILIVVATAVFAAIKLAGLPGAVARQRNHPQADAVSMAGWLSLLTLFALWPAALIWAYCRPLSVSVVEPTPEGAGRGKGGA